MTPTDPVDLGFATTTAADIARIASGAPVRLAPDALAAVQRCHEMIGRAIDGGVAIYGLTTGVGDLYSVRLGRDEISRAQLNMLRSHASGVGKPHDPRAIRAMMATMIKAMLQGVSGVSPAMIETMAEMLNRGVTPWSPSGGSVGYLIATAHIGLAMFGHGKAWYQGELLPGGEALRRAGIAVRAPGPREGHALISGTYEITGIGALAVVRHRALMDLADVAGAMSLEVMRGNTRGYDPRLHRLRPHPGQMHTAERLNRLLEGSEILAANRDHRLQDALSLRCIPQVHGAVRDALDHVDRVLETEINSVTDNPVFMIEDDGLVALPGGNGHGAPTALVLDFLGVAIAEASGLSQAHSDRLTNTHLSGLPAFLGTGAGSDSGLMIPPYAAAALCADNRALAMPMTVHTISTCAGQEDHVSMGVTAAMKAVQAADNYADILAIEFLCAAQAMEFHRPLRAGRATQAAYDLIRTEVPPRHVDNDIHSELAAIRAMLDDGRMAAATMVQDSAM